MEVRKERLKPGDIFWEKYNGKYFFSRVILDIKKVKNKLAELDPTGLGNNNLNGNGLFNSGYYVEVYKGIYDKPELLKKEVLFIGIFSGDDFHSKKYYEGEGWQYYDNDSLDIKNIDFPEGFKMFSPWMYFCKGEVKIKTDINWDDVHHIQSELEKGMGMAFDFETIIIRALIVQNRLELIKQEELKPISVGYDFMKKKDMRFDKPFREKIYKLIGEDPNISYYDLAKKHGIDTDRLFE